jgi:hypothetical protein
MCEMRSLLTEETLKAVAFALILAAIAAWLGPLGQASMIGLGVFLLAALALAGRQIPSSRINGRRVRVLWGLDDPRPGTVVRWINMERGRTAEVLLDGEDKPILLPLGSLEFPWYERIRHYLPVHIRWRSAPD